MSATEAWKVRKYYENDTYCWFWSFMEFVDNNKNTDYHKPLSFKINIDSVIVSTLTLNILNVCVVVFLQWCVATCCPSFHTADTPALRALWWTPGVTSPATPAIASRGNTHAPVSAGAHGAEHSQIVQVHSVLLLQNSSHLYCCPVFHYSFISPDPCVQAHSQADFLLLSSLD